MECKCSGSIGDPSGLNAESAACCAFPVEREGNKARLISRALDIKGWWDAGR